MAAVIGSSGRVVSLKRDNRSLSTSPPNVFPVNASRDCISISSAANRWRQTGCLMSDTLRLHAAEFRVWRAACFVDLCRGVAPAPPPVAPAWAASKCAPKLAQNVIFFDVIAERVAKDAYQWKLLGLVCLRF